MRVPRVPRVPGECECLVMADALPSTSQCVVGVAYAKGSEIACSRASNAEGGVDIYNKSCLPAFSEPRLHTPRGLL